MVGVVAVVAFVAARMALLPGVAFWDTGEFQTVGPLMGTAHPTGFPTYTIVGWLASVVLQPFGDPAVRMNLLSAICVAVAAGVTVDLVRSLTGSLALGAAAGIGLALTPIVWSIGTRADPHALHLALFALLLRLLVGWEDRVRDGRATADRWLVASAVVVGLAMGNHSLTLLLGLPIAVYVLLVQPGILRRTRLVITCVAALVITLVVVYAELPLRAGPFRAPLVYGRPDTWEGFWYVVLAEQFRGSLLDPFGDVAGKFHVLVDRTVAQFGILAAFIPIGLVATALRRPNYAVLTGLAVAITGFFAASYQNADIGRYYLGPILIAWTWVAILAGVAAEGAAVLMGGRVPLEDETATAGVDRRPAGTPLVAGLIALLLLVPTAFAADARYASVDRSQDRTTQAWLDDVLARLEPDSVVVSWWSFSTPLWYAQKVEGRRPDIVIVDDRTRLDEGLGSVRDVIDANLGRVPVYLLRENLSAIPNLEALYEIETITNDEDLGVFIRVLRPRDAA